WRLRGRPRDRDPRREGRMSTALASCRDVVVDYGSGSARVRALAGVSLDVEPGGRVALRGRSGSGKTTLMHVLGGLVRPSVGTVGGERRGAASLDGTARPRAAP